MTPIETISRRHGVPVAVIMASPNNGKGYDAQCEYIASLKAGGLDVDAICLVFGRSQRWVERRLLRHADNVKPEETT